jgi:hypothetical protein
MFVDTLFSFSPNGNASATNFTLAVLHMFMTFHVTFLKISVFQLHLRCYISAT